MSAMDGQMNEFVKLAQGELKELRAEVARLTKENNTLWKQNYELAKAAKKGGQTHG